MLTMNGEIDPDALPPLVLAYIGDAVYELYTRTYLIGTGEYVDVNSMHEETVHYVKAETQAKLASIVLELLTEREHYIFKRGRNAKSSHVPRSASVGEYRYSTGLESLIGYLYLKKDYVRLREILQHLGSIPNEKKAGD